MATNPGLTWRVEYVSYGKGDTSGPSDLISGGTLTKFADNPSSLATPAALEQGKSLVGKILGSADLTITDAVNQVASAGHTGILDKVKNLAEKVFG